jgi:hypothetical protein
MTWRKRCLMTATLDDPTKKKQESTAEAEAARELVRMAQEQCPSLTGPDGLLNQLTKTVIETADSLKTSVKCLPSGLEADLACRALS